MLDFLTRPRFPKHALGFERDLITALSLTKEGKRHFTISAATTMDLDENVLVPSFIEPNILNRTFLLNSLREIVETAGLQKVTDWSASLPSATSRTAILVLENPPSGNEERERILDWKAERAFGAEVSGLRVSLEKIAADEKGSIRYFATAVNLSVLEEFESVFAELGWRVGLILPRSVSEARWLLNPEFRNDSLLISGQTEGFTALLIRENAPRIVRTVSCSDAEFADEFYRLLMFYNDRLGGGTGSSLERILFFGDEDQRPRIGQIAQEALGKNLNILRAADVGLEIPSTSLRFSEVAAAAGIAALAWG
jgi:hypothetical protein